MYGNNAFLYRKKNLYFEDRKLRSAIPAPKAIGGAFGLKVGEMAAFKDETGLIIVKRMPNTPKNERPKREKKEKISPQVRLYLKTIQYLEELAQPYDLRYRFYM